MFTQTREVNSICEIDVMCDVFRGGLPLAEDNLVNYQQVYHSRLQVLYPSFNRLCFFLICYLIYLLINYMCTNYLQLISPNLLVIY